MGYYLLIETVKKVCAMKNRLIQFFIAISLFAFGFAFAQTPPVAPLKAGAPSTEPLLGTGDVIKITVFQNPDLTLETKISELGNITFPLVGNVQLGGLTPTQAQDRIAKMLVDGNFVLKPQVNVQLVQVRSSQISVLGQVLKPGRYPIESNNARISELISIAGGVLPAGADVITLVGKRNGESVKYDIDLAAILQAGRTDQDVIVANGDIIYVDRAPTFYIYGEVQRPGSLRLERGMTLMQALAQAGGVTQRGTVRGIRINRRDANGVVQVIQPNLLDMVERDDVIYIKESLF
jgi:polysaccharide biosynthesis/export protein